MESGCYEATSERVLSLGARSTAASFSKSGNKPNGFVPPNESRLTRMPFTSRDLNATPIIEGTGWQVGGRFASSLHCLPSNVAISCDGLSPGLKSKLLSSLTSGGKEGSIQKWQFSAWTTTCKPVMPRPTSHECDHYNHSLLGRTPLQPQSSV